MPDRLWFCYHDCNFVPFLCAKFSCCRATAISEDEARDALLAFVAENCCYGKKAAEDMEIKDITPSSAYHVSVTHSDIL